MHSLTIDTAEITPVYNFAAAEKMGQRLGHLMMRLEEQLTPECYARVSDGAISHADDSITRDAYGNLSTAGVAHVTAYFEGAMALLTMSATVIESDPYVTA